MNIDSTSRTVNLWKWLILLVIAGVSFYLTFPVEKNIRYGLDLQGGTSFTLGVDVDELREKIIRQTFTSQTELDQIATTPSMTNETSAVGQKVRETLANCDDRIIEIVRRRVDGMGLNEPVIMPLKKDHRLVVQLPGMHEAARDAARQELKSAAFLEFCLVVPQNDKLVSELMSSGKCPEGYVKGGAGFMPVSSNFNQIVMSPGYKTRLSMFGVRDPLHRFVLQEVDQGGVKSYKGAFVERRPSTRSGKAITGDFLTSASVGSDLSGLAIDFSFNAEGAELFGEVTGKNKGRQLAILLDGVMISAPVIQSKITERGQITGHFSPEEARRLARDLNVGALPAPLKLLAESTVSPTVGEAAKGNGMIAACCGFALVALFMLIYYWYAGFVADVALVLDILLLPAALVFVQGVLGLFVSNAGDAGSNLSLPVLTMPGIAGLVLTLGMAVDANVIIFERIREEFAAKASVGTALKNGYGRAFTAIFDSNVTTIVTGIILFLVGTGPVRGFAITLTGGVIISMFTAVVVTRLVFDHTANPDASKPFKMLSVFKNVPHIDFVKLGKPFALFASAVVLLSMIVFFARAFSKPASVLGVDLTGGTELVYAVQDSSNKMTDVSVRKALEFFDNGMIIQFNKDKGELHLKTSYTADNIASAKAAQGATDVASFVTTSLQQAFPEATFHKASVEEVGSMVGADLKKSGTLAVLLSLCAILIYVAFRFEFGFGLGALVALAHDALISLGLFSLCGRQVSLLVITALLTIIGYSVNDTIVVFDRIREDLRRDQKTSFRDLCNRALNQCLSRTVITSVTTFFAVAALFAFGDGTIFDFALTMLIGVVAGTFSSMFIATPVMMWFYKGRRPQFANETERK